MAKSKTVYSCQHCGAQSPKWLGKCPDCNQWNTYIEETFSTDVSKSNFINTSVAAQPLPLNTISKEAGNHISMGISELDRVLGGGYVPGSAILIGGEPGIGKSTLLLQMLAQLNGQKKKVLYISGEESAAQIKNRAERLQVGNSSLLLCTESNLESILKAIQSEKPDFVALDSIQTAYSSFLTSAPGTVSQVRECCGQLINFAKQSNTTCFLVGHVTKEGAIAGPKVLEHMVDVVLYFESDQGHTFRILRSVKNRFGATNEIGVFEMTQTGLKEILNPSHLFLSQRNQTAAGSAVVCSMEGTRPLLLEVQALVASSSLANPRRTAIGVDSSRVALLVAVLEKMIGAQLSNQDIFVNLAGGMKVQEPALDLGIAVSVFSSLRNQPLPADAVFIGEIGLTGELRAVSLTELRLREAAKLGFKRAFIPASEKNKIKVERLEVTPLPSLDRILANLF